MVRVIQILNLQPTILSMVNKSGRLRNDLKSFFGKIMKTIVFSCKYSNIVPYFAIQFNKYFSPLWPVVVLSPRDIPELPSNFEVFKLPQYSSSWCDDLIPFFDQFTDTCFHACMEDHFLYDHVNISDVRAGQSLIGLNKIDKFGFQVGPREGSIPFKLSNDLEHLYPNLEQQTRYCNLISTLQPSVWRTDLFRKLLYTSRGKSAWQFETENREPFWAIENIGVFKIHPEPYPVADIVRQGASRKGGNAIPNNDFWTSRITDPDDLKVFTAATKEIFG